MDAVGIRAIFGGFILGTAMPRGRFAAEMKKHIEPVPVVLLLPMFFNLFGPPAFTGIAPVILLVSIAARFGACYVAAHLSGEDNRTALAIVALMNSRGLTELIIINIGLQKGMMGPARFSMLVLMAVVTRMMVGPLFELFYGKAARAGGEPNALAASVS